MKISDVRGCYYESSDKVSELVRQLSLAGIAVIWIFKVGDQTGGISYSEELLWPLGFLVVSLGFDLLQYVYKALLFGFMNTYFWRKHRSDDAEVTFSERWNWPTITLFWVKTSLVVVGYVLLLKYIGGELGEK